MKPPPFTPDQATKTLPLVSRIARDIVRLYAKWRERVAELELAAATSRADDPDPRLTELERNTQDLAPKSKPAFARSRSSAPNTRRHSMPGSSTSRPSWMAVLFIFAGDWARPRWTTGMRSTGASPGASRSSPNRSPD